MNTPKVSVIMPCFNDGSYIEEAIQSIVHQTYQNWDLIIVDDGSTDQATIDFLNSIDHPSIRVLRKENGGVSTARNRGIRDSDAEYILPFDADDVAEPAYLEKAVATLQSSPDVGVVSCYERFFPGNQFEKTLMVWKPEGGGVENFLVTSNANANSVIRYRCWEEAGGYDETLPSHEDWAFWVRITSLGWRVAVLPEVLLHYRRSPTSKLTKHIRNRPRFVKHIVETNLAVFQANVALCVSLREEEILKLKEENREALERIRRSREYRIGRAVVWPWRKFRRMVARSPGIGRG